MSMRRALLLSTGERYIGMVINFASVAAVSRLLTPQEVGLLAVGVAITNLVETLRDLGATSFVIQQPDTAREVPRTAFAVMSLLTLLVAVPMLLFADGLAALYGDARLASLIRILAFSFLPGPFLAIPFAIMRREMNFAVPAIINITLVATGAIATAIFALMGASYLSAAYAFLLGNVVGVPLLVMLRRDLTWVYRPTLARLRDTLTFGGYSAVSGLLLGLYEFLPNFYLGRMLGLAAFGQYNRAVVVVSLPDKLILNGFATVALPAFSALARDGHNLKDAYLKGLTFLSVAKFPVHILVAILAEPIVKVLLGPQWSAAIPVVQLLSLAAIIGFLGVLVWPVLVAAGAIKQYMRALLISLPLAAATMAVAAQFGLIALALNSFLATTILTIPGAYYVHHVLDVKLLEALGAIRKSCIVTAVSMTVPALAYFASDHISFAMAILIGLLGGVGWLVGLRITGHPLMDEINRLIDAALRTPVLQRYLALIPASVRSVLAASAGRDRA